MPKTHIETAIRQLHMVRGLLKKFLDDVADDEWFWMPPGEVTHIAWQVGHIAFAEYALCMKRLRGALPEDEQIISANHIKHFGRGSTPVAGAENNPSREDILAMLNRVHAQALAELGEHTDAELDIACDPKHPVFTTNLEAVLWAPVHEATHVGQIVLLRRLIGREPAW